MSCQLARAWPFRMRAAIPRKSAGGASNHSRPQAAPQALGNRGAASFLRGLNLLGRPEPRVRASGTAGFVRGTGSLSLNQLDEGDMRENIVEADLVECIVGFPGDAPVTGAEHERES